MFANVGGIYLNEKHVGDPVDAYKSVPKERHAPPCCSLLGQLADPDWMDDEGVMRKIQFMGSPRLTCRSPSSAPCHERREGRELRAA